MSDLRSRQPLRAPSVAEIAAAILRNRIVSGELQDGQLLPKQSELLAELGVGKPSLREAVRILEAEGLLTVRRGNVGGAVVHAPRADTAAHMMALVLQTEGATVGNTAEALALVESTCASLCAQRKDRAKAVVPRLRAVNAEFRDAVAADDFSGATATSRRFHEELVALCGNPTLIALVGVLETLWSAHYERWAAEVQAAKVALPAQEDRQRAVSEHEELIELIGAGKVEETLLASMRHLRSVKEYPLRDLQADTPIDAATILAHVRERS